MIFETILYIAFIAILLSLIPPLNKRAKERKKVLEADPSNLDYYNYSKASLSNYIVERSVRYPELRKKYKDSNWDSAIVTITEKTSNVSRSVVLDIDDLKERARFCPDSAETLRILVVDNLEEITIKEFKDAFLLETRAIEKEILSSQILSGVTNEIDTI